MKIIKNVYLSGLGAVGCAYASKLYDMDPNCIKVIADNERIERYTKSGVIINNKPYPFKYIQPQEDIAPADLLLIAVKHYNLKESINDVGKFVGKDTIIISLLNGILSEDIIGKEFGMDKILYSMCVGLDAVREGTSTRFTTTGKIVFGDRKNSSYSPNITAVKGLLERAKISYLIPEDMIQQLWWKFMVNVGINQTSAVLKAPYGVFQNLKEAKELMEMSAREVVSLANKAGINLKENDINEFNRILQTLSPDGKTSMLQDVEAGRKTEVEIFAGTVIELGKKYGISTPVNEMLFNMIRTLEQMYPSWE